VLASEAFAAANHLNLDDTLSAILNGKQATVLLVGIVLSPEYVYASPPGDPIPDDKRFGILWLNHSALAAAFDMDGAFNDVSLSFGPDAQASGVKEQLDQILAPYGGTIRLRPLSASFEPFPYLRDRAAGHDVVSAFALTQIKPYRAKASQSFARVVVRALANKFQ